MNKYLNRQEILSIIGKFELEQGFQPMSQDSYNEEKIAVKIAATKMVPQLCEVAINLAVVGYGNKRYGNYRVNEKIVEIKSIFDMTGVLYKNPAGAMLKEDDLTPNRLCRFFRYEIQAYIRSNKVQTYLFRKYTDRNKDYFDICFRGSEYIDELTLDQVNYLLIAYRNLDLRLNTKISERITRVTEAKGKMNQVIL